MVDLQAHRYELYWLNLWRNVNPAQPILNDHLAILDRSSLSRDDVETHKLDFDGYQIEQLLLKSHMPHHRWTYFSEMAADEILVFPQGKGVAERDGRRSERKGLRAQSATTSLAIRRLGARFSLSIVKIPRP